MESAIARHASPGVRDGAPRTGVLRAARKVVVAVAGTAVLIAGVALLVLPGPAFLVIPAGLAILATEFLWARRLLRHAKERAVRLLRPLRRLGPGERTLRTVQGRGGPPRSGGADGARPQDASEGAREEMEMRVVHFARADDRPHAEALCGDWGAMDTDWTDVAKGVSCPACRATLRDERFDAAGVADRRRFDERRDGDGW